MIDLGASIISSTIATVLFYPAERIKIEIQLNTVKSKDQEFVQKQLTNLLELEEDDKVQLIQEQKQEDKEYPNSQRPKLKKSQSKKKKQEQDVTLQISDIRKRKKSMSIAETTLQIYKKHGWTGFYTGLQSLVLGNGLSYGVYFVLYQKCKQFLGFEPGSVFDTIKCSSLAGIGSSVATNPFWVLQTKQTQQKGSILHKGKQLIESQGIMALWKGLSSSLILVSNPIIQFVVYEQLKKIIPVDKDSKLYDLVIFIIGAISKIISTLCTYPLTVVRTKQHISKEKKQWQHIVQEIIGKDGVRGLFKGVQPKLIQTVLNSALLLMLFEKIRNLLISYFVSKS